MPPPATAPPGPVLVAFGTRPEVIKLAPVVRALRRREVPTYLLSTGQHREMLEQMLADCEVVPDRDLALMRRDQSLAGLSAEILRAVDALLAEVAPRWVVVQGDTTTVAMVALAAFYRKVPVAHVEAGLRTHEKYDPFPEEMNRALLGRLADLHFAPTPRARDNLLREGVAAERIAEVGNTVVDSLRWMEARVRGRSAAELGLDLPAAGVTESRLVLVTGHRRESFGAGLAAVFRGLRRVAETLGDDVTVLYPVHLNPNVRAAAHEILGGVANVRLTEPLGYAAFVKALTLATLVVTDSGGVQEEAAALGVPVLVTRNTSERREAIAAGVAELVGTDADRLATAALRLLGDEDERRRRAIPSDVFGDGFSGERIAASLAAALADPAPPSPPSPMSDPAVRDRADAPVPARRRQHVWVVLPAFNEEQDLAALLESIDESMFEARLEYRVLLVDDGSTDRTVEIARRFAEERPLVIVQHARNLGLGATIRNGLMKAAELAEPNDIVITMDADNSHTPELIVRMVRVVREGHDVVIASRFRPESQVRGVPFVRRVLSFWGCWLFRLVFPTPGLRDYTCGYRAYRAELLQRIVALHGESFFDQEGFQCMVDILLRLRRWPDLVFGEVPLVLRYDRKAGASKMRVTRTAIATLGLIARRRLAP